MLYWVAFITGLFGSFHCAGMCGPIAFALPGNKLNKTRFYVGRLLNNLGRITTYALLGSVMGAFGFGMKLAGYQQEISIAAGILILIMVSLNLIRKRSISFNPLSLFSSKQVKGVFESNSLGALFVLGLFHGLLPCGFVYIALAGAGTAQSFQEGALFMFCFGLGTFPMMFLVSLLGQFLSQKIRRNFSRLSPVFAILIGVLFILRGLNLGIPYISPQLIQQTPQSEICH